MRPAPANPALKQAKAAFEAEPLTRDIFMFRPAGAAETWYLGGPMPLPRLPDNDGWTEVAYELGEDSGDNARIGRILNEVCHVFRHHAEGTWVTHDKDAYARLLVDEIRKRPGLAARLLATDDRVVKMITHRALELLKSDPKAP